MRKILVLLILAGIGFAGFKFLNSDPEKDSKRIAQIQAIVNKPIESAEDKAIVIALEVGVKVANKQLAGKEANANTKIVDMEVGPGRRLTMNIQRTDLEKSMFLVMDKEKKQVFIDKICSETFSKTILDKDFVVTANVVDKNNKPIGAINVVKSDCK